MKDFELRFKEGGSSFKVVYFHSDVTSTPQYRFYHADTPMHRGVEPNWIIAPGDSLEGDEAAHMAAIYLDKVLSDR